MVSIIRGCQLKLNFGPELSWNEASITDAMSSGHVIGAIIDNKLVGFILFINLGTEMKGPYEIWCLATHPDYHKKGVMGSLLNEIKALTSEIWLEVHERNKQAMEFYKHKEFHEVGVRKRYYEDGGDAILFSWNREKHKEF